jgi:hypothetical protein
MLLDITRNQFFYAGLVLLALGVQFRYVEAVQLTPEFTQMIGQGTGSPTAAVNTIGQSLVQSERPILAATVRLPDWLGYSLMSIGAVLVLHAMAMRAPGGG